MGVLIKQLSWSQFKALAQRCQKQPMPSNATLNQTQEWLARSLGHEDLHAAQRFYAVSQEAMPVKDDRVAGNSEQALDFLMGLLEKDHRTEWPHWHASRLTMGSVLKQIAGSSPLVTSFSVSEVLAALERLSGAIQKDLAHSGTVRMAWFRVLGDHFVIQTASHQAAWHQRDYRTTLLWNAQAQEEVRQAIEATHGAHPDQAMWLARTLSLWDAMHEALTEWVPPPSGWRVGHVHDLMLPEVLADLAPRVSSPRLTHYLRSLPGYRSGEPWSESLQDHHGYLVMQIRWALARWLRPDAFAEPKWPARCSAIHPAALVFHSVMLE